MPIENESNNSIIPSGSNGLIRVQHSIEITNKILKERDNRLVQSDYESVKIGNQIWMTKNLNVDRFRNGDLIPEVKSSEEWKKAGLEGKPAWSYCYNDPKNGEIYGKLYNWFAVNDKRGLAPFTWQVPNEKEWNYLIEFLGGDAIAGVKMKHTTGWYRNNNGNNLSGFTGVAGGYRNDEGEFIASLLDIGGYWWSSTSKNEQESFIRFLGWNIDSIKNGNIKNSFGFSIRCIRE